MWVTKNERLPVDDRYDLIVVGAGSRAPPRRWLAHGAAQRRC